MAADRSSQLQPVSDAKLVDEIGRHFTVGYTLDCQRKQFVLRCRRNRVAALRLVSIIGREANIHVLARLMAERTGGLEQEGLDAVSLGHDAADLGELPFQPFRW